MVRLYVLELGSGLQAALEVVLPFLVPGVPALAAAVAVGWWADRRRMTVKWPPPVWADIRAEVRVDEMLRRVARAGLYARRRMRNDGLGVILEHSNGARERRLLDLENL